jgi:23S rRNA (guanine2445-N2)-methyltransferase / 23S rRNA (guanine2069-N7)-methyltransferase
VTAGTRYFAPCPKGLEYLLVDELKALGASEAREALAGVHFAGDATLGYRACLWSRLASRVLLPLAEFPAEDARALYEGASAIEWEDHLAPDGTLAVDAHGRTRELVNTQFVAQRVKDAIVDRLRTASGMRPTVDTTRPSLRVNVVLRHGRATLSIDLAGDALFARGWRRGQGAAPLKENLAAALLLRGRWPEIHRAGGALVDPLCGSGTLLIEGALMAADVAPALDRDYFGFLGWRGFDAAAWRASKAEAEQRARAGLSALTPVFYGSDVDAALLGAVKQNAQAAGVAGFVRLSHVPVGRLARPQGETTGLVVANPPYGERLGDASELAPLYRDIGATLKREFAGWRAAVITSNPALAHAIGLKAERRYAMMNGALECTLYCFDRIEAGELRAPGPRPLAPAAADLRNRLDKNLRKLKAWRAREAVTCFRTYDADLPEYAAAIDVYEAAAAGAGEAGRRWLHVAEYQAPKDVPEAKAQRRLDEIVRVAGDVLEVPAERIAIKTRRVQSRHDKYRRQDDRGGFIEVTEGGLRFLVNLFDYLDTGLFLDHRPMRARVRELARGRRFLNLFCYTASVSVYAADGGAASTTSVDLSANYLEWAARNLALNGFDTQAHRLVQADSMAWLAAERGTYDLIFADPPTFSNSKRADDFDVQRDHVKLLELAAGRLAPDGLILFSNNFRRFAPDGAALEALGLAIKDVTRSSIPPDFERDARIHHAFEVRRRR